MSTKSGAAGLEVIGQQVIRFRIDAPLDGDARRVAIDELSLAQRQLADRLDAEDMWALDAIADHPELFIEASRQIVLARTRSAGAGPRAAE